MVQFTIHKFSVPELVEGQELFPALRYNLFLAEKARKRIFSRILGTIGARVWWNLGLPSLYLSLGEFIIFSGDSIPYIAVTILKAVESFLSTTVVIFKALYLVFSIGDPFTLAIEPLFLTTDTILKATGLIL